MLRQIPSAWLLRSYGCLDSRLARPVVRLVLKLWPWTDRLVDHMPIRPILLRGRFSAVLLRCECVPTQRFNLRGGLLDVVRCLPHMVCPSLSG